MTGSGTATQSSLRTHKRGSKTRSRHDAAPRSPSLLYGLALAVVVGILAMVLGKWMPLIGGPVFGILLGMALRNTIGVGPVFKPGLQFASKQVLQWSIIALGFGLSIQQVARTGLESLWVTLITITAAFVSAWLLGRWLGIGSRLKTLIGVGTAICGGSAIAAITPIIKPDDHETAFAISTIFIFNIVAVLLFPALGHLLNMSDAGFGLWAGTAINDTSSVVAAGYSYSQAAGDAATIVKLTRATLIIPICLVLAIVVAWREKKQGSQGFSLARIFPWFILWFLVASALRSTGLIPESLNSSLHLLAQFLIVVALTAIGLSSDLRRMATAGIRPIMLGLGVWVSVAVSSLIVQYLMGSW
ncbi:YeiH family protein [Allopusillimonas ginsengisoli]|uniref:YeiH family protein n=1 Tax=Allopusillimonas ginsengisoli TaxID=453575 RepID=UPI00102008B8|nr:YeiH family protein [Allopusillimonas ginsengisoli]TEA79453.1 YeiH family putative sulfate export transporter [Allopusillimonas ginsengisoli]